MRKTSLLFVFLGAVQFFLMFSAGSAVTNDEMDKIRNKPLPDSGDLAAIDQFLAERIEEILKARDFSAISKVRAAITIRSSSMAESAKALYARLFSESAYNHISAGLEKAATLPAEERRVKVRLNLLILIYELGDVRLTPLAMKMLDNDNALIRYWAVRCITG